MNFIKRAMLGITRKKGKSLILLAVIFILGNLISGAISIQQATNNVESTIKDRLGAAATLELDYELLESLDDEAWENIGYVGVDTINQVGQLSYVKYYDYSMATYLGSESFTSYQGEGMEDMDFSYEGPSMDFFLKGVNYPSVIDFEEERGQLIEGRVFTTEEVDSGSAVGIISKKLAELNDIQVGDTFILTSEVYNYSESSDGEELIASRDVALEIIGLFEPLSVNDSSSDDGMLDFMDMEYQNTVYVPNEVVSSESKFYMEEYMKVDAEFAQIMEDEEEMEYYTPLFVLNSPEDTEAFKEEVMPLLPDYYTVRSASDHYSNISAPIESMSKLSTYVLAAAIGATVLISGLVVLLFLRDRKHELGIYLSLGERRSRVVGQVLIEVMVIAFIAITLSLFTGNLLAQGVSGSMLNNDQMNDEEIYYYYDDFSTNVTTDDVLDSYEITLDATYMLIFYSVGLLTILVSTVIPLIYIVRLNPKKILM